MERKIFQTIDQPTSEVLPGDSIRDGVEAWLPFQGYAFLDGAGDGMGASVAFIY